MFHRIQKTWSFLCENDFDNEFNLFSRCKASHMIMNVTVLELDFVVLPSRVSDLN